MKSAPLSSNKAKASPETEKLRAEVIDLRNRIYLQKEALKKRYEAPNATSFGTLKRDVWSSGIDAESFASGSEFRYDFVLKTPDIKSLSQTGWILEVRNKDTRENMASTLESTKKRDDRDGKEKEKETNGDAKGDDASKKLTRNAGFRIQQAPIEGQSSELAEQSFAVVGVLGYYNRGKTWLLNKLLDSNFPSYQKIPTEGLSFALAKSPSHTSWLLLDTVGFGSPLPCKPPFSRIGIKRDFCGRVCESEEGKGVSASVNMCFIKIVKEEAGEALATSTTILKGLKRDHSQAQVMEYFLRDFTFHASELIVVVVNNMTLSEQKLIALLESSVENKAIVIVHNFRDITTQKDLENAWKVHPLPPPTPAPSLFLSFSLPLSLSFFLSFSHIQFFAFSLSCLSLDLLQSLSKLTDFSLFYVETSHKFVSRLYRGDVDQSGSVRIHQC